MKIFLGYARFPDPEDSYMRRMAAVEQGIAALPGATLLSPADPVVQADLIVVVFDIESDMLFQSIAGAISGRKMMRIFYSGDAKGDETRNQQIEALKAKKLAEARAHISDQAQAYMMFANPIRIRTDDDIIGTVANILRRSAEASQVERAVC